MYISMCITWSPVGLVGMDSCLLVLPVIYRIFILPFPDNSLSSLTHSLHVKMVSHQCLLNMCVVICMYF